LWSSSEIPNLQVLVCNCGCCFFSILIFIYSFIHLFIYSFIHLFIYSFIHLFIYSFIHLFIYSFFYSLIHAFSQSHLRAGGRRGVGVELETACERTSTQVNSHLFIKPSEPEITTRSQEASLLHSSQLGCLDVRICSDSHMVKGALCLSGWWRGGGARCCYA